MIVDNSKTIIVSVCYCLNGVRICKILPKEKAQSLRKHVESEGGTVYWFNATDG